MAVVLKIKWVDQTDQSDPCERIRRIGGATREIQWTHTQAEAIRFIEYGLFAYFIEKDARALELRIARTADGGKYLTTRDGDGQVLLGLPGSLTPTALSQPA
jgi:hypothetical protein